MLDYTVSGAETIHLQLGTPSDPLQRATLSGRVTVRPLESSVYSITAQNANGRVTASARVEVVPVKVAQLRSRIKHIVFFMQENRSFDVYFGMLGKYREKRGLPNDIDGLDTFNTVLYDRYGHPVRPFRFQSVCHERLSPAWNETQYSAHYYPLTPTSGEFRVNEYPMQGFLIPTNSIPEQFDTHGTRAMGYFDERDFPFYYELATQYATSDRWFASLMSATPPNRRYLFQATSAGMHQREDPPPGGWPEKTIFRLLTEHNISWAYYYQDDSVFLAKFADWSNDFIRGQVRPISEYFDILSRPTADQDLPQVVFIERDGNGADGFVGDESPGTDPQAGAASARRIIMALLQSAAWPTSVFIHTYDEPGGHYDHVPPAKTVSPDYIPPRLLPTDWPGSFDETGLRVPLIVVSPWARKHFVSHKERELTSILKFIQTRFNLPPLTRRDAWADDMLEFFDFDSAPRLAIPPLPEQPVHGQTDPKRCSWEFSMEPGHPK